eukprot:6866946-Pyramimonas_sp.AAC.2
MAVVQSFTGHVNIPLGCDVSPDGNYYVTGWLLLCHRMVTIMSPDGYQFCHRMVTIMSPDGYYYVTGWLLICHRMVLSYHVNIPLVCDVSPDGN